MCRLQTEEEAKHQALRLSEQLAEIHKKHEEEVKWKEIKTNLNFSHTDFSDLWPCIQEIVSKGICSAEVFLSRMQNIWHSAFLKLTFYFEERKILEGGVPPIVSQ